MPALRAFLTVAVLALAGATGAHAQSGQQAYLNFCQGCHNFPGNNHNRVLNGKDWRVIRQAIDNLLEMRIELRPLYLAGILDDADLMAIASYLQTFPGGPPSPVQVTVVEYFNAGFGHYFMSADVDEVAGLDAGAFGGAFVRTGREFRGWSLPNNGTVPVCRFFTTPGTFGTRSSHFYTANPAECDVVKLNPDWIYEKFAFHVAVPSGGACAAGTVPVHRMYNDGQTGAPNHRFTTDLALYQQFTTTLGWLPEDVAFCAPP